MVLDAAAAMASKARVDGPLAPRAGSPGGFRWLLGFAVPLRRGAKLGIRPLRDSLASAITAQLVPGAATRAAPRAGTKNFASFGGG